MKRNIRFLLFFCKFANNIYIGLYIDMTMARLNNWLCIAISLLAFVTNAYAQTAKPTVSFYSDIDEENKTLSEGESTSTNAPCDITCNANLDYDEEQFDKVVSEWKIYRSDEGESKPILDRYEENVTYTLEKSGGYVIKFYATFINNSTGMTIDYETESGFTIVISESKLTCVDAFSPNDDGINDILKIECQSLVKVSGVVKNRWGKTLHTFTLDNIADGWNGKVNGKPVKDGAYIVHIDAIGSDGLHYKIKKVVSVLKGYKETDDSSSDN